MKTTTKSTIKNDFGRRQLNKSMRKWERNFRRSRKIDAQALHRSLPLKILSPNRRRVLKEMKADA